jgi:hypothetical protein
MISTLLILAAAASTAATQAGNAGAPVGAQTDTAQKPDLAKKERRICVNIERIGSRVARSRVCRTKAEWDEIEAESKSAVKDFQRNSASLPSNGG